MHGYRLRFLVYSIIALVPALYLTFWGLAGSWSENILLATAWVLTVLLIGCAMSFGELEAYHPDREDVLYKPFKIKLRYHQLARFTKWAFFAIMIFPLKEVINLECQKSPFPDELHFVATMSAVVGLFMIINKRAKNQKVWFLYGAGILLSGIWLALEFIFHWTDVKYPEFALLTIGLLYIFKYELRTTKL